MRVHLVQNIKPKANCTDMLVHLVQKIKQKDGNEAFKAHTSHVGKPIAVKSTSWVSPFTVHKYQKEH